MRLLPLLLLAACGYKFVDDRGMARMADGSLPRIAVAPFDNETFRRGLEIRLTRLLDDELRGRGAQPAAGPEDADWSLKGSIVEARERVISEDLQDRVRQSSFIVTVSVVLEDRTAEKVIGTYSFTESEPFTDRAGRIATLEQAEQEVLRNLAESIVYWLEDKKVD